MPRRTHKHEGIGHNFLPCFENLEERLLLTTVNGGEFFVYHNSVGDSVRISLHGEESDRIELFGYDDAFDGVVDLVGLPNGDAGLQKTWPDGLNIVDTEGDNPRWIEYDTEPDEGESPRGSRTEIYAIYIARCSENTIITISTLAANEPSGEGWTTDITQFSSSNLPVLSFLTDPLLGELEYAEAPSGSGGVVIGSKRDPYIDPDDPDNNDPTRHSAVALTTDMVEGVPVIGVFPGGDLAAGISIAATEAYALITALDSDGLGTDVQAVATDGTDAYVVDLSAYFGKIISDGSVSGLGSNIRAIASDAAGNMFGVDSGDVGETSSLVSIDSATGGCTLIGLLQGVADPVTVIYRNVAGMDFDNGGLLYATATVEDLNVADPSVATGLYLITIDPATGAVTRGPAITGMTAVSSIAFNAAGTLYGVNSTNRTLYTINTVTGAATAIAGSLPVSGFVGIEFLDVGGNEVLYGATNRRIYAINPANPAANAILGDTSRAGLTSLTFDATQPGMLWSSGVQNGYRLVRIDQSSILVKCDNAGTVTNLGLLFDSANPAFAYDGVHALTFDSAGNLWGIGTLVTIDPIHSPIPDAAGPFLIKIDKLTGVATRQVADPLDVTDLTSMAFDSADDLYGVNPDGDRLVLINTTNATTFFISNMDITGVVGIDFDAFDILYAVTSDSLYYTLDITTGEFIKKKWVGITGMTSLDTIPGDPANMYSTVRIDGTYHLITVNVASGSGGMDMGRIIIGGTLAGSLTNAGGSINLIEMGFLWGKIDVDQNIGQVIIREGGGGLIVGESPNLFLIQPSKITLIPDPEDPMFPLVFMEPDSWIDADGSITEVSTRGGILYSFIRAQNDPDVTVPSDIIYELEYALWNPTPEAIDSHWLAGDLVDYDNNSTTNAQFLAHPTGNFSLLGNLSNDDGSGDWYALPLLAGQTVTIDGGGGWGFPDPRNWYYPFTGTWMSVFMYDSSGNLMDSLGYETVEDMGMGSAGATQKPITFTAPAADVYYIHVFEEEPKAGSSYTLSITNGAAADLGAVNVVGDYDGQLRYDLYEYDSGPEADTPNIMATNAGTIGAVVVSGNTYDVVARTFGADRVAGDIVAYMAGRIGPPNKTIEPDNITYSYDGIYSDGNIGRVASTTGGFAADVSAGYSDGMYNHDAFIHNIFCVGDFIAGNIISASGSIGVIEIAGTIEGISLAVNDDSLGETGHVDLIDVGGDWGSVWGIPSLSHGPGGDFGYINVDGEIWVQYTPGSIVPVEPTVFTDGQSGILNDDGGGRLTVTPEITPGMPIPTWSYVYIGVDDDAYPGYGVGGVIANFSINGSATLSSDGVVQITDMNLNGLAAGSVITIEGDGQVDIWYVHGDDDVDSLINSTGGGLVSGNFGGNVSDLRIAGSVGPTSGNTAAWLHGYEAAPVSGDIDTEPQYGWFHGTVNGLTVEGNLETAYIGGALGDLRALGEIGEVIV
ncbi:MAG: hypothetical protein SVV80_01125, partial [Planctomycetota bacterium]|nr:hypothetical protein [Planctomycetota bacterium]